MTRTQLAELIDAFASAKASGNMRLTVWAGEQLKAALDTLPESWGEEQPPQQAAQPTESQS